MAEKAGNAGLGATTTIRVEGPLIAHPDGGGGLLGRIPGWAGFEPIHVWLELPGVDPGSWVTARGRPSLGPAGVTWLIQNTPDTTDTSNGPRVTAVASYSDNPAGEQVIEPAIQLDGPALAAAGAPVSFRAMVDLRRLLSMNTSGQLLVGDFATVAQLGPTPNDLDAYLVNALTRVRFTGSNVTLAVASAGLPARVVNQCSVTFSDPWARVWLGPADIGLGPQQLPPDLALVSAERLRLFPSIFIRRNEYIHAVRAPTGASENPVNTPQSAPRVIITRRPPTYSRWRLWIDGRMADVWVRHPEGSDLRTPYLVWNAVFAAQFLRATVTEPFPVYRQIIDLGGTTYHVQGLMGRNTYLEAAEFVAFGDDDQDQVGLMEVQHFNPA